MEQRRRIWVWEAEEEELVERPMKKKLRMYWHKRRWGK